MKEKLHFCGLSTAIDGTLKSSGFSRLGGIVLVFLFLFINVESWGQSVGDYQSSGTGDGFWTSASSWQRWDGDSWETATYYPGEITTPNQETYGAVTILKEHTITISSVGITTSLMGAIRIEGILILDGTISTPIEFFLNTLTIDIIYVLPKVDANGNVTKPGIFGEIIFNYKSRLKLPENSVISVTQEDASIETQDAYYEGLTVTTPCNHTQQIFIGDLELAFCRGRGQGLTFEQLMSLGGNLGAVIYVSPFDCLNNEVEVNGDFIHNQTNTVTRSWLVKFHNGTSISTLTVPNTESFPLPLTNQGVYEITLTVSENTNGKTYTNTRVLYLTTKYDAVWQGTYWQTYPNPFNPTNPIPVYPETSKKVIIKGDYDTNTYGSFTTCSLEVDLSKALVINPYYYVEVYNDILNNGYITVEDKGSLVQVNETNNNIGSGTYFIHKKVGGDIPNYSYIYWSSPLENQDINTVFTDNRQDRIFQHFAQNYLDVANYRPLIYTDKSTDGFDDNRDDWGTATGPMATGKGYIVMAKGSPTTFDRAWKDNLIADPQNVVFTGSEVHNGTYNSLQVFKDLYNGTPLGAEYEVANLNTNLIGNPYPSAIDIIELVRANKDVLTGTFYFWMHETGLEQAIGTSSFNFSNANYKTVKVSLDQYRNPTGVIPSDFKYISSGQGFMANVEESIISPTDLVFKNSMRVLDNNNTFKRKGLINQDIDVLSLQLTDDKGLDRSIYIAFKENGLDTYRDGEDARRLIRGGQADFYSLIPENKTQLAIQTLSLFDENKTVALGMDLNMSGNYQINLKELEGVFAEDQKVYLQDLEEGVLHDFSKGAYTFYSEPGITINDRFVLRFTNTKTAFGTEETNWEDLKIYPNPSKGLFNISYFDTAPLRIELYDLSGKQLKITNGTNQIDLSGYAKGIYFAKIQTETNSVTKKLVVE